MGKLNSRLSRGFTLLEILVATIILLLILLAVYEMFDQSRWLFVGVENQTNNQQNVRIVTENLERDLRMAGGGVPPSVSTGTPQFWTPYIFTADTSKVYFHADVDSRTTIATADVTGSSLPVEDAGIVCPSAGWSLVLWAADARQWQPVNCTSIAGNTLNFSPAPALGFTAASTTVYSPETIFYRLTNDTNNDGICDDRNGDSILCDNATSKNAGGDFPFCKIERAVQFGNDPAGDRDVNAAEFETLAENICVFQLSYSQTDGTAFTVPVTGGFLQGIHRVQATITSKSRTSQGPGRYQDITLTSDILVRSVKY